MFRRIITATAAAGLAALLAWWLYQPASPEAARARALLGERWYALTQGPGGQVTVVVSGVAENLDVNLWLFTGCGPNAVCLGYADDNLANQGEVLTWTNEHPTENVTVYLAVDAVREPETPPDSDPPLMSYSLQILCQGSVPTKETSFGSLKSLYR